MKELFLPFAVVSLVGIIVFPLPSLLLDILLILNITFSLTLLVNTIYLSEPEKFTVLPTLLLLTTLFRLGLNIATTRNILSAEPTPEIISAFGEFFTSGNLVVGAVVFMIITIIQFVVISKGAERVAEVTARFTLDAMPGKQMAIDADVRAGLLSLSEAKEKRKELQQESKLYGALDGAMKFVKGDTIAGILIIILNITAGLILGVVQQGMSLADSATHYTLLTIGDGLVAQIPALLVATSAGIVITRVAGEVNSNMSLDLISQLGREPKALAMTGLVLLGLAFIPVLPTFLFLFIGIFFLACARIIRRKKIKGTQQEEEVVFKPKVYSALVICLTKESALQLQSERQLPQRFYKIRERIFNQWGIYIPDLQFDIDVHLAGNSFKLFLNGIVCEEHVYTSSVTITDYVEQKLEAFIVGHIEELVNDTHTRFLIEAYNSIAEDLINSVVPTAITVTGLTVLLKQLIQERVSIKEFTNILQAIAVYKLQLDNGLMKVNNQTLTRQLLSQLGEGGSAENKKLNFQNELLSEVRIALKRTISNSLPKKQKVVSAVLLDNDLDKLMSLTALNGVPVSVDILQMFYRKAQELREKYSTRDNSLIILSSKFARRQVFELLAQSCSELIVVAVEELCVDTKLEILETFGVEVGEELSFDKGDEQRGEG
ncbi:MAG: flagellar biosynthesis protein FlhA [Deltaproteobacteria bacterium]|jgi:flagellar biosynthesis component FlhA|nr:flagellar biosynthesis protein FlhA [Deltaproteobacteria bacterium]